MTMMQEFLDDDAMLQERARKYPVMHGLETGARAMAYMALFIVGADALSISMFEGRPTQRVVFVAVIGAIALLRTWISMRFQRAAT